MNLNAETISSRCPDVPAGAVAEHLARLPSAYLERIDAQAAGEHLRALSQLSGKRPVEVLVSDLGGGRVGCTVIAFDHPFEFSLIAGSLAAAGFEIIAGDVYTLPAASAPQRQDAPRRFGRHRPQRFRPRPVVSRNPHTAAVIIDSFTGALDDAPGSDESFEPWSTRLAEQITEVITLLDRDDDESIQRARQLVNERVTRRLALMAGAPLPTLYPIDVDLRDLGGGRIRLKLEAQDTPAYLYALTTALSLRGLSIERVRISTDAESSRIADEFDILVPRIETRVDDGLLDRIRVSASLTKQFTYFLTRSPDPYTALTRFEWMTDEILTGEGGADTDRWIEVLANPDTMRNLARLLGTSDFLWQDFIRGQSGELLEILASHEPDSPFTEPAETLPARLEQALDGAVGLAQQQDRLNKFKDRELFLIDLDHILNPAVQFRELSQRLTLLAEALVTAAARLVYADLVTSHGAPPSAGPMPKRARGDRLHYRAIPVDALPYAVFGLGKLGGVALGYASDIELLFIYDGDPTAMTAGGKRRPIAVAEFFEQHVSEVSRFIRTKREGIFEVDLRLRPYGKDSPLATSAEQFTRYYGPRGQAHPFERMALVRLRWIAGNPRLGYAVEDQRDLFVYDSPLSEKDFDALWDVWSRAKQEKLAGHSLLNAKYSPGALVDLEGVIQLLQVTHASAAPQLRVPRLSAAMEALHRAGVLSPGEYGDLRSAYEFLRQLINALRMLRGNARDLFIPPPGSLDCAHLAGRMGYQLTAPGSSAPAPAPAPGSSAPAPAPGSSAPAPGSSAPGNSGGEQLHADFARHTAKVQAFIEARFERPCPGTG